MPPTYRTYPTSHPITLLALLCFSRRTPHPAAASKAACSHSVLGFAFSLGIQPAGAAPSLHPSAGNSSQPTNKRRHPNPNFTLGSQCCPPLWPVSISLALLTLRLGVRHQICATLKKPPPTLFAGRLGRRNFLTISPQFSGPWTHKSSCRMGNTSPIPGPEGRRA
jgi:hypothetical protein